MTEMRDVDGNVYKEKRPIFVQVGRDATQHMRMAMILITRRLTTSIMSL